MLINRCFDHLSCPPTEPRWNICRCKSLGDFAGLVISEIDCLVVVTVNNQSAKEGGLIESVSLLENIDLGNSLKSH